MKITRDNYLYMRNKYGKPNLKLELVNNRIVAYIYGILVDFTDESFNKIEAERKRRMEAKLNENI